MVSQGRGKAPKDSRPTRGPVEGFTLSPRHTQMMINSSPDAIPDQSFPQENKDHATAPHQDVISMILVTKEQVFVVVTSSP